MKRILSGDQGKASPILPMHVNLPGVIKQKKPEGGDPSGLCISEEERNSVRPR